MAEVIVLGALGYLFAVTLSTYFCLCVVPYFLYGRKPKE